ncbi:MAG: GDP-mannose 4,6-dehydratase, partial [Bacteriovorax sp.]|nr:GDP-mannose 4,6-dehydratase [Bacteriovorax sp.]
SPINPYGSSKLFSEQMIRDCEIEFGLKSVVLRYFNVAGASESMRFGQLSKNATHLIKIASEVACGKRESMSITGTDYATPDGTGVRDYIHVEDLADIHVLAIKYLLAGGATELFNCGYGHGSSVREVIETIRKVSGVNLKADEGPRRLGDAAQLVADSSKVRRTLGWIPKRDNLETICRTAYLFEKALK